MLRQNAISHIFKKHGDHSIYVINTGYLSRAVFNMYPGKTNIFYMQGSMGLAPSIGLGLALFSKRNIVVISGDASLLMHLGITHTIRDCNLKNLFVYILNNNCHESVGGQPCSRLEKEYIGIDEIFNISNDGQCPRIKWKCTEITKNIIEFA